MRNIYMYIWHFSQHFSTQHIRPHYIHPKHKMFVDICFRFVQTLVFLLPFSLLHNLSETFLNAYKLFFVLVHNIYITH